MIRVAEARDAVAISEIYRPIVVDTAISFETEAPSAKEIELRIEKTLPRYPWLVYEEDRNIVGYAYAGELRSRAAYRWSAETSVYVRESAQGRSIGRWLYVALLALLVRQRFVAAFAGITLPNDKSVRLHESLGFLPVGVFRKVGFKLGAWHDVGFWRRLLVVVEPALPGEPEPFSKLPRGEVSDLLADSVPKVGLEPTTPRL